jgi:hypothetical protein
MRKGRATGGRIRGRGYYEGRGGEREVAPGKGGREDPYMLQYRSKKHIEGTLRDEGFFDNAEDNATAETVFVS